MKPVPVAFHLGPVQIHTYGIGLALTFWFALRYMRRRFDAAGYPSEWLNGAFPRVVGAALVGARLVHVLANLSLYRHHPGDVLAVWNGGLSSFGGLLFGTVVAVRLKRTRAPDLAVMPALDVAAPVLAASWALGRLLGPQFEVNGGGHLTHAWFGLAYAGQIGERVPVPLFQSVETFAIFVILRGIEERTGRNPTGVVVAAFAGMWGVVRFTDEFFWLATPRLWDAVEVTGLALAVVGWSTVVRMLGRRPAPAGRAAQTGSPVPISTRSP